MRTKDFDPRVNYRKPRKDTSEQTIDTIAHIVLIIGSFLMIFPFIWMISSSLKTQVENMTYPPSLIPAVPQWHNYVYVFEVSPFLRFYWNSIITTAAIVFGQLITCSMGAYAFSRRVFRGRDKLFLVYLGTLMIPSQVTMIPTYIIISKLKLIDTYSAIIIPSLFSAYGTFMLRQFFMGIPKELEESVFIDGGGAYCCFFNIIIPLTKTALITFGTFVFQFAWNNYLWPLLVTNSKEMFTIPIGIQLFVGQFITDYGGMMATATMAMVPMIIVYLFAQKYFISGIALTGIKA